jgi:23S rRNA (pseudouridine1915-N3)-methyltransferase
LKINIDLIVVGNLKEKPMKMLCDEYLKRLQAYSKVNVFELKDESNNHDEKTVLTREGERIKKVLDLKSYIIVMDINQKQFSSEEFAYKMTDIATYHASKITFIIGGSLGVEQEIKDLANERVSFSKMTFPHQLFRVMLLEQIYRGFRINNNAPYHK